jgi:hypothetical protein
MQLRKTAALVVYLGSYLPLSLILLAQDIDLTTLRRGFCGLRPMLSCACTIPLKHAIVALLAVAISATCFAISVVVLRLLPTPRRLVVTESKHVPADLINYVIPYILSFISLDYGDPSKFIGFVIFFSWIFWITFKSGQIVLNPVLAVLGWKLFEVKYKFFGGTDVFTGRILSSTDIEPGKIYKYGGMQDVIIVKDTGS